MLWHDSVFAALIGNKISFPKTSIYLCTVPYEIKSIKFFINYSDLLLFFALIKNESLKEMLPKEPKGESNFPITLASASAILLKTNLALIAFWGLKKITVTGSGTFG
jgi:hypothetical protein